jgi:hypothetical protein
MEMRVGTVHICTATCVDYKEEGEGRAISNMTEATAALDLV